MAGVSLQVHTLVDPFTSENMMTSSDCFREAEAMQYSAEVVEVEIRVGTTAQQLDYQLLAPGHVARLPPCGALGEPRKGRPPPDLHAKKYRY